MSNEEQNLLYDLSSRFGALEQGVKDLGKNFDKWCKKFDGNGQPGRCQNERAAREELAERVQALEDVRKRAAWLGAILTVIRAAGAVVAAAMILAFLKHFFHWL